MYHPQPEYSLLSIYLTSFDELSAPDGTVERVDVGAGQDILRSRNERAVDELRAYYRENIRPDKETAYRAHLASWQRQREGVAVRSGEGKDRWRQDTRITRSEARAGGVIFPKAHHPVATIWFPNDEIIKLTPELDQLGSLRYRLAGRSGRDSHLINSASDFNKLLAAIIAERAELCSHRNVRVCSEFEVCSNSSLTQHGRGIGKFFSFQELIDTLPARPVEPDFKSDETSWLAQQEVQQWSLTEEVAGWRGECIYESQIQALALGQDAAAESVPMQSIVTALNQLGDAGWHVVHVAEDKTLRHGLNLPVRSGPTGFRFLLMRSRPAMSDVPEGGTS